MENKTTESEDYITFKIPRKAFTDKRYEEVALRLKALETEMLEIKRTLKRCGIIIY